MCKDLIMTGITIKMVQFTKEILNELKNTKKKKYYSIAQSTKKQKEKLKILQNK